MRIRSLAGERYVRGRAMWGYGMGATRARCAWKINACRSGCRGCEAKGARSRCPPCGVAGSGEGDEVLRRRVLYGISCRNDEAAAEAIPGTIDCPVRPWLDPFGGLLVVIDGGEGLRADAPEGPSERRRPCSGASGTSAKRENVVGYLQKGDRSFGEDGCDAPMTGPMPRRTRHWGLAGRARRPESVRRRESRRGPGGDPDLAPLGGLGRARRFLQDQELPRVRPCPHRGAPRQDRCLEELEPAPSVTCDRAPRHRTETATREGLSALAEASRRIAMRTEDRSDRKQDPTRSMIRGQRGRFEFQLTMA